MTMRSKPVAFQIGWLNSKKQSPKTVPFYLVWQALLELREEGVEWLDLGAMDSDKGEGVSHFKRGLGGEDWPLAGTYV